MFYSQSILTKKGALASIWLAAHWDRKLTKTQIVQTNIENSVDEILSGKSGPLALRLSGQLLLGIVRIYWRKAKYLFDDVNDAIQKIKMMFRPGMVNMTFEQAQGLLTIDEENFEIQDFSNFNFDINMEMLDEIFEKAMSAGNLKKINLNDGGAFDLIAIANPSSLVQDLDWQPWDNGDSVADIEALRASQSFGSDSFGGRESLGSIEMARDALEADVPFSPADSLKKIDFETDYERRKSTSAESVTMENNDPLGSLSQQSGFEGFDSIPFEPMEFDEPLDRDFYSADQAATAINDMETTTKENVNFTSSSIVFSSTAPVQKSKPVSRKKKEEIDDSLQIPSNVVSSQMKNTSEICRKRQFHFYDEFTEKRLKSFSESTVPSFVFLLTENSEIKNLYPKAFPAKISHLQSQTNQTENVIEQPAIADDIIAPSATFDNDLQTDNFVPADTENQAAEFDGFQADDFGFEPSFDQSFDGALAPVEEEQEQMEKSSFTAESASQNFLDGFAVSEEAEEEEAEESQTSSFDKQSKAAINFLKQEFSSRNVVCMNFEEISKEHSFDKKSAATLFFELLALKTKKMIHVEQESAFGTISIKVGDDFLRN